MADLLARDAPWAGAPSAVAVAKRPTGSTRAGAGRNGSAPAAYRPAPRVAPARNAVGRLRSLAATAWGPQWRFVTIAAAVLFAGLMANGVMLVAFSGAGHNAIAESDEGGYPTTDDPNAASRVYDDNGFPIDSALTPMFSAPGTGDLSAANTSGVRLPLTLTSLGTTAPAASPTATTRVLRGAPAVSTPVRAVSPTPTGTSTGTGSVSTSSKSSSSGGVVGDVVRDTTSGLGETVDDTASGLGRTVEKTTSGLGKTLKKTTTGLGDTLGNVTDDLLGGGGSSKSKSNSSSGRSSNGSRSSSHGGLVGSLLGR